MKKLLSLFILIQLIALTGNAQEKIEGIGLLPEAYFLSEIESMNGSYIFEISLYKEPEKAMNACLGRKPSDTKYQTRHYLEENQVESEIRYQDIPMIWVGYKSHAIQVFDIQKRFAKIKIHNKDYWLSLDELEQIGMQYKSWKDFFHVAKENVLSSSLGNHVLCNMNLRASHDVQSQKIALIEINRGNKDSYHLFRFRGEYVGNWAKIEVHFFDDMGHACSGKAKANRVETGWIKYLDDTGYPNVFNIPSPCC